MDMDAWTIMHRTELFTPEEEDVHFTDEEFQAIKDELAKHSRVEICDHMEKDETTRDDLKIKVWPNKTPKEFKVIWYLKIKDMFGEGIKYNQLALLFIRYFCVMMAAFFMASVKMKAIATIKLLRGLKL